MISFTVSSMVGSPPLVRERLAGMSAAQVAARITPARAGKTLLVKPLLLISWDHPRSCGKDSPAMALLYNFGGSPPLVRERQKSKHQRPDDYGITPARAGKTVMDSFIFALLRLLTFKIYSTSLPNI